MKKLILSLIVSLNLFALSAEMLTREYTTDKETDERIKIEEYENKSDGLIKRIYHQGVDGKYFVEDFYENSPMAFVKKEWYGLNLETKLYDKLVCFYTQESEKDYRESVIKTIDNKLFFYTTIFYKTNKRKIKSVEGLYSYESEKPVYRIYNYFEEMPDMTIEDSFEYDDNNKVSKYTQKVKNRTDKLKLVEEYFSYPEFSFEESLSESVSFIPHNNYRQQVLYFEENKTGLIKQINTRNPDGTYFKEYFIDTQVSNTQFNILRDKYDKDGNYIFEEQIYEDEPLYGKVYIYHMDIGDDEIIINEIYYDKDGNEIPKSELEELF